MTEDQIRQYHEKIDESIKKYGYQSTFVFDKGTPSFCYATGIFKSFGIPEIFISSLPQNFSRALMKAYVNKYKSAESVPLNQRIDDLTERFPVYLIKAPFGKLADYVLSSIRFHFSQNPYLNIQTL